MTLALDRPTVCESTPDTPGPRAVVGAALRVPLVTGGSTTYANLDHAASAPCLELVRDAVEEFLPWYASVHRGAGFASQVSTRIYERTRNVLRRFVQARSTDTVIFTRNTTDSFNLLARSLPRNTSVVQFDTEHHAALLPWRGPPVRHLPTPRNRLDAVSAVDIALGQCPTGPRLLVVTGASNVTGELFPVAELAAVARRHGARIALDAAQLAPHHSVSIRKLDVDYVALSGHKLYAPFGAGALVGRADWLRAATPYLAGGGAGKLVTTDGTRARAVWNTGPQRHEAGSPNTVGVYALGVACAELERCRDEVLAHETALLNRLRSGLAAVPGLVQLRLFDEDEDGADPQAVATVSDGADPQAVATVSDGADPQAVATVSFVVTGLDSGLLAAVLSAEYGIGVRDGAFCAHVATRRLIGRTGIDAEQALRVSIGLGTTEEHVDRLVRALREVIARGPRWDYARQDGHWAPSPDPRALPDLLEGWGDDATAAAT